jgi:diadenosine tetraphosphate (Ap4A) HIT family hydrolase
MTSGYLVLCDEQSPRGWCILLSVPVVTDLDDLPPEQQRAFLSDMAAAGAVVKRVMGACRVNYSILGNAEPALHAHIQPRYATEPEEFRRQPIWAIRAKLPSTPFDPRRDGPMMQAIREALAAGRRCG